MARMRAWLFAGMIAVAGCSGRHHASAPVPVVIDSVSPAFGVRTGGDTVTITGSGFGSKPFVTFGINNITSFVSVTDTQIVLVSPADHIGPASVTVVNAGGGIATRVSAFDYLPLPAQPYDGRFFADSPDSTHANLVVVGTAGIVE